MRKIKLTAVVLSIVILTGLLSACGAAAIEKPEVPPDVTTVEITGSCGLKVEGSTITVTGETSFINGTILYVSIVAQSGIQLASEKIKQTNDDKIEVKFTIPPEGYGDNVKSITAMITAAPTIYGKQIGNVYTEYGNKFELITNNTVWNKDGNIVTFASELYEF